MRLVGLSRRYLGGNRLSRFRNFKHLFFVHLGAFDVFHVARLQTAFAHDEAVRYADQFPVGKHDARADVAVVQNDVYARGLEVLVELVRSFAHGFALLVVHRADDGFKGGDGLGPHNALVVVTLFDGSADEAGNADTVATHFKGLRLAVFVKERCVHRFGILRAEVEDVSDFDTALQLQFPLAAGARIPFDDVAEVFDEGFGEVAPEVDARVVEAGNVGAAAEIRHIGDGAVGVDDDTIEKVVPYDSGEGGILYFKSGVTMTYSKVMTCNSTAYYSGGDGGAAWTTAVGAKVGIGTIAVDPTVIPYYTKMFIQTSNGSRVYGMGTALDCGGAIKGNIVDLWFPTKADCYSWGRRNVTVYILDRKSS